MDRTTIDSRFNDQYFIRMNNALFLATLVGLSATLTTQADILSMNFTDANSADSTMLSGDIAGAGAAQAANWNNINAAVQGTGFALPVYDDGSPSTATVDFSTDLANHRLGHAVVDGHDRMWKGNLDVENAATVTFNGLEFVGNYDVYVYFDGSNGAGWRVAEFTIGGTTLRGEDSENTNWGTGQNTGKVYQLPVAGPNNNQPFPTSPNNNEGNYVVFSGISGNAFSIDAAGGSNNGLFRAPINGIQIVGTLVPEPSAAALFLLGGLALIRRCRR